VVYERRSLAYVRSLYDVSGKPSLEQVTRVSGDRCGDVVGWFKFRRNSTLRMSYRETLAHTQMAHIVGASEAAGRNGIVRGPGLFALHHPQPPMNTRAI